MLRNLVFFQNYSRKSLISQELLEVEPFNNLEDVQKVNTFKMNIIKSEYCKYTNCYILKNHKNLIQQD